MDCTLLDVMPSDPRPEDGIVICVNSSCIRLPPSVKTTDYYELLYDRKEKIDNTTNDECAECGFKAKSHIIAFHQKHVHGPVVAECPLCRKQLWEDGVLARHIATEHFEAGTLVYSTRHATRVAGGNGVAREDIIRERSVLAEHDDALVQCATCHKVSVREEGNLIQQCLTLFHISLSCTVHTLSDTVHVAVTKSEACQHGCGSEPVAILMRESNIQHVLRYPNSLTIMHQALDLHWEQVILRLVCDS